MTSAVGQDGPRVGAAGGPLDATRQAVGRVGATVARLLGGSSESSAGTGDEATARPATVYVTRGLLDVLLELARDAEPGSVTVRLSVTRADRFDGLDLPGETPVFTHFVHPETARSTSAVFGVDLGTPLGGTQGIFVSHPAGERTITKRDTLHEVVLVAVPPWDAAADVAAYDRAGRSLPLERLDASPPEESLPLDDDE